MSKPRFITFTGVDESTSIAEMIRLHEQYPIEWGVLFSKSRSSDTSEARYPGLGFITELVNNSAPMNFSAHLCGEYARSVVRDDRCEMDGVIRDRFWRAQINTAEGNINTQFLAEWGVRNHLTPILQCRESFPPDFAVGWLFDASGGRGVEPKAWPAPRSTWHARAMTKGYAGGLNPDNVAQHVAVIGERDTSYWIDMESGVRDENDLFDLARCRAVCEAVYGRGHGAAR